MEAEDIRIVDPKDETFERIPKIILGNWVEDQGIIDFSASENHSENNSENNNNSHNSHNSIELLTDNDKN